MGSMRYGREGYEVEPAQGKEEKRKSDAVDNNGLYSSLCGAIDQLLDKGIKR